ncbi:Zinc finger, CCHC-type [Phytophthora cactorum]|nr:Zinc finger, CCHC-type [Phytophthora cactorum]
MNLLGGERHGHGDSHWRQAQRKQQGSFKLDGLVVDELPRGVEGCSAWRKRVDGHVCGDDGLCLDVHDAGTGHDVSLRVPRLRAWSERGFLSVHLWREVAAKPRKKRLKAAVRQTTADGQRKGSAQAKGGGRSDGDQHACGSEQRGNTTCYRCGQVGHWSINCTNPVKPKCYACGKLGHYPRECTDKCGDQGRMAAVRAVRVQKDGTRTEAGMSAVSGGDESMDAVDEMEVCSDEHDEPLVRAENTSGGETYEWVEQMKEDEESRDEERAARYVATVRPAMAASLFVRAGQDERRKSVVADSEGHDRRPTGEGEVRLPTGEGASSNGVVSNTTENAELVMDAAVPAVDAANSEGTSTGDDNSCTNREGYCVERARLERREVRKQAK